MLVAVEAAVWVAGATAVSVAVGTALWVAVGTALCVAVGWELGVAVGWTLGVGDGGAVAVAVAALVPLGGAVMVGLGGGSVTVVLAVRVALGAIVWLGAAVSLGAGGAVGLGATSVALAVALAVDSAVAVDGGVAVGGSVALELGGAVGVNAFGGVAVSGGVAVDWAVAVAVAAGESVTAILGVGVAGQPCRALATAATNSLMTMRPSPSTSPAARRSRPPPLRPMSTSVTNSAMLTAPSPLQSPTQAARATGAAHNTIAARAKVCRVTRPTVQPAHGSVNAGRVVVGQFDPGDDHGCEPEPLRGIDPPMPQKRAVAIHLIEKDNRIELVNFSADEWKSPYWDVSESVAEELKEAAGDIYFHVTRNAPSRFGGRIFDFEKQPDGEWEGRITFYFRFDEDHRGVKTERTGWGQEKKIVWQTE
ncbi:MAG: hypothetical protein ABI629_25380 [bacterium]